MRALHGSVAIAGSCVLAVAWRMLLIDTLTSSLGTQINVCLQPTRPAAPARTKLVWRHWWHFWLFGPVHDTDLNLGNCLLVLICSLTTQCFHACWAERAVSQPAGGCLPPMITSTICMVPSC